MCEQRGKAVRTRVEGGCERPQHAAEERTNATSVRTVRLRVMRNQICHFYLQKTSRNAIRHIHECTLSFRSPSLSLLHALPRRRRLRRTRERAFAAKRAQAPPRRRRRRRATASSDRSNCSATRFAPQAKRPRTSCSSG